MSKETIFEIYSILLFSEYVSLRVCILLRVARINNEKNMYIWDRMLFMGESLFMKTLGSEV